jgi:hypothetical protein
MVGCAATAGRRSIKSVAFRPEIGWLIAGCRVRRAGLLICTRLRTNATWPATLRETFGRDNGTVRRPSHNGGRGAITGTLDLVGRRVAIAVFRYFDQLREIQLSGTDRRGYIASIVRDDALNFPRRDAGDFYCAECLVAWCLVAWQSFVERYDPDDQTLFSARALQPFGSITGTRTARNDRPRISGRADCGANG